MTERQRTLLLRYSEKGGRKMGGGWGEGEEDLSWQYSSFDIQPAQRVVVDVLCVM